ncbi:hypothetical protein G7Y89_g6754 [Cudoniella acicularis]|uniref:Uncharacterized protein n=1 Tax=Cudoniella acicularis TaxID=354080 RepID=A0A8H4W4G4_9HELO|nr:hypothetical protein G7Y89_g6754 [Cudoniella acicularis]
MAPGGAGGWSDAEKYSLLLQIIKQIGGDRLSIKFDKIVLPGRTPKAMTHVWAKIRAEAAEFGESTDASAAVPATPRKRGPAKDKAAATPKKPKASPKKKASKKADSDEETAEMPDLGDTSEDDVKKSESEEEELEDQFHEAEEV